MRSLIHFLAIIVLVASYVIFPSAVGRVAAAEPWYVATTGNDSNDCLSPLFPCLTIQTAINKASDGDTINVAPGVYADVVRIRQRKNLTIQGNSIAKIAAPAVLTQGAVLLIELSENIRILDLTISGDISRMGGVLAVSSRAINFQRCTIENGLGGITAAGPSDVNIADSIVQGNRNNGIRVDAPATVQLMGTPFSNGTSIVQQNPFGGVIVNGGHFAALGSAVIRNNAIGILSEAGTVGSCCGAGELKVLSNVVGISVRGGNLELRGPALIEGNTQVGIQVTGGSASFGRFSTERVIVRENGAAGILAIGSHLDVALVDVLNNTGRGLLLRDSSSARISSSLFSNNGNAGVRVEGFSSVQLFNSAIMQNNQGLDFSCTPNSNAWGDRSGVTRMFCAGFDQSADPVPSGPNNP